MGWEEDRMRHERKGGIFEEYVWGVGGLVPSGSAHVLRLSNLAEKKSAVLSLLLQLRTGHLGNSGIPILCEVSQQWRKKPYLAYFLTLFLFFCHFAPQRHPQTPLQGAGIESRSHYRTGSGEGLGEDEGAVARNSTFPAEDTIATWWYSPSELQWLYNSQEHSRLHP